MEQVRNEQIIYSAAVYCRLSKDDEQAGESVSIETQKMMLTDFCHERGFSIYEIYAKETREPSPCLPYIYTYDNRGNIIEVRDSSDTLVAHYAYDDLNQLVREDNNESGYSATYEYDCGGNMTAKHTYAYTLGELGTATSDHTYTYGNANWGDLLTSYDGKAITYDGVGNMLTYGTRSFSWMMGRRLAGITDTGLTTSYSYDSDGVRTQKTVNGVVTDYILDGGQVVGEKSGSNYISYEYDAAGKLVAMVYNGTKYYYVTNAMGDVLGLMNTSGDMVVNYRYDPYGQVLSVNGSMASTVGAANPFRYRGYYYDTETGLYYVSSRYYDPEIGRWINADRLIDDGAGLQGANLFQYCGNNPINNFDPTGQFVITISSCIAIGSVVIGALAFGHTAATSYKYTGSVDWLGATINGVGWGLTAYTMGMSAYGVYCNYSYSTGKTPVTSVNIGNSSAPVYPPNDGFNATPRSSTLSPGSTLQRSGGVQGKFVAPVNTPVEKLSLPPDKINAPITYYTVLKPIQVQAGTAMSWFNQPGGGTQFLLPDSIANLQKNGYLEIFPK